MVIYVELVVYNAIQYCIAGTVLCIPTAGILTTFNVYFTLNSGSH